jgi:oxygen-dependent protoporphyrinogen oxidase
MKRIVIIGGGISGLAAAHRLTELARETEQPLKITLLDSSSSLGGIIKTDHRDGFLLERGPDSFISEKPEAIKLAQRLDIDARLIQTNEQFRRSFIVREGRLRKVPEGFQLLAPSRFWPFVTTDIFSLSGKLRMAADLFLPRANANGSNDESLASFVSRRLGKEALDRMAQPMVGGIYTADPRTLSLRATLPRFLEMEREHRSIILAMLRQRKTSESAASGVSGPRYSLFLSFDDGMQVLTDELERNISHAGVKIQLNSKVTGLDRATPDRQTDWTITTSDNSQIQADGVCLAIPAYSAATMLEKIDNRLGQQLRSIEYTSTATINFGYRRRDVQHPLDGFGFVVPLIEKRSLIACTFSSVKFSGRSPEEHVLLRAFVGGALQPEIFELDETKMIERVKSDLEQLLVIHGEPLFTETAKWSRSMPQYYVGHLERISAIETQVSSLRSVTLAGNSYRGAGIPDCIRSGETAAEKLFDLVAQYPDTSG